MKNYFFLVFFNNLILLFRKFNCFIDIFLNISDYKFRFNFEYFLLLSLYEWVGCEVLNIFFFIFIFRFKIIK